MEEAGQEEVREVHFDAGRSGALRSEGEPEVPLSEGHVRRW